MGRLDGIDRLGPEDMRILDLERGPVVGHITKLLIVEPPDHQAPLDVGRLRAAVLERLPYAPRCQDRLQPLPRGLGRPVWVADPSFDIAHHVRPAAGIRSPVDADGLRHLVARLITERLDRDRPLWTIDVAPLSGGRVALVWRIHHCMADGMTALRLGAELLWDEDEAPARPPTAAAAERRSRAYSRSELLVAATADRMRGALRLARAGAGMARDTGGLRNVMLGARVVPGTVIRELVPTVRDSPLDARIGHRRAVGWTSTSLEELHSAAKAAGDTVTLNDAVIALVAAGINRWLATQRRSVRRLRMRIPVSLHHPGEGPAAPGNRDSFIDVDVPLRASSILDRVREVSRQTAERKRHHDAEHLDALFRDVGALPFGAHALVMTGGPHEFSLCVSNVAGPRGTLRVLGGRVAELYSIVEIAERHPLCVAVLSASGRLTIGICSDPDVIDPAEVIEGIESGIAELTQTHSNG